MTSESDNAKPLHYISFNLLKINQLKTCIHFVYTGKKNVDGLLSQREHHFIRFFRCLFNTTLIKL